MTTTAPEYRIYDLASMSPIARLPTMTVALEVARTISRDHDYQGSRLTIRRADNPAVEDDRWQAAMQNGSLCPR